MWVFTVFEGDIFAQTAAIPRWHALDQTLLTDSMTGLFKVEVHVAV